MNVLIFSNSPNCGFGYSVVATRIADYLKEHYNVFYFGLQSIHPPKKDGGITYLGIKYDAWGKDALEDYLRAYKIDVLITIMDIWMDSTLYIPQAVKNTKTRWIAHLTINSLNVPPYLKRVLPFTDMNIVPSKFAQKILLDEGINSVYIPHGVNTSVFRPLPEEQTEKIKKQLKIEDKEFVVLSVMRNKSPMQKDFPALFKAWKQFVDKLSNKNVVLLLLTDPFEPTGLRLDLIRAMYKLEDTVKFVWTKPSSDYSKLVPTFEGDFEGFSYSANNALREEEMAKLYNVADLHVITSPGESFSLPTLEAMACGTPVIVPSATAPAEYVMESNGGLICDSRRDFLSFNLGEQKLVDIDNLTSLFEYAYANSEMMKDMGKNAEKYAKSYDWKYILPQWKKVTEIVSVPKVDYNKEELGI